jgi:hypothetical protein
VPPVPPPAVNRTSPPPTSVGVAPSSVSFQGYWKAIPLPSSSAMPVPPTPVTTGELAG